MSQVSRKPLSENVKKKIFTLFFTSLANISKPKDIQTFIFDLLSPAEQMMLVKRLAIAILLEKGYRYETIKEILSVSQETIARVNMVLNYRGDGYKMVVRKVLRDEAFEEVFEKIEQGIVSVLPNSSIKKSLKREVNEKQKRKVKL